MTGFFVWKSVACSKAYAALYIVCSSKCFPIICKPTGKPSENPAGIDIPGNPAKLTGTVKISYIYIVIGSLIFSPKPKATVGVEGPIIKS